MVYGYQWLEVQGIVAKRWVSIHLHPGQLPRTTKTIYNLSWPLIQLETTSNPICSSGYWYLSLIAIAGLQSSSIYPRVDTAGVTERDRGPGSETRWWSTHETVQAAQVYALNLMLTRRIPKSVNVNTDNTLTGRKTFDIGFAVQERRKSSTYSQKVIHP